MEKKPPYLQVFEIYPHLRNVTVRFGDVERASVSVPIGLSTPIAPAKTPQQSGVGCAGGWSCRGGGGRRGRGHRDAI